MLLQSDSNTGPAGCRAGIERYIRYAATPDTILIMSIQSLMNLPSDYLYADIRN